MFNFGFHSFFLYNSFYCLMKLLRSDICHLMISGVGVNIATEILCESDCCNSKFSVSRKNCVPVGFLGLFVNGRYHCMQVYWSSGLKSCFCYLFLMIRYYGCKKWDFVWCVMTPKMKYDSKVSWTVYKWDVLYCT